MLFEVYVKNPDLKVLELIKGLPGVKLIEHSTHVAVVSVARETMLDALKRQCIISKKVDIENHHSRKPTDIS